MITTVSALDSTEYGLPKREMARFITSWKQTKVQSDTKLQNYAVAKAHGAPIAMIPCDWTSIMNAVKLKYGEGLAEDVLAAQSCFGMMRPESLAQVASLAEEQTQDDMKPEAQRQYGTSFGSKRRHVSTLPVPS